MRNIRCHKCSSVIAKEEGDRIIFRTGFGKRQVFHAFNKDNGTITCWMCKEVINIGAKNEFSKKSR